MWLSNSSVGRKVVMSITGLFLILFVTFHVLMNAVALISPEGYNAVCHFLGANWYALIATVILAAGFVVHILLSFVISLQNRKARGNDKYDVNKKPKSVEWASQNMLVLGIIVVCFMIVHLIQFWYKMQWQELMGTEYNGIHPADGMAFIYLAFKDWWTLVIYLIGFGALWFHMSHGFWSAFHSMGINNNIWMSRLRKISMGWATVVCLLFAVEAVVFTVQANCLDCCPVKTEAPACKKDAKKDCDKKKDCAKADACCPEKKEACKVECE